MRRSKCSEKVAALKKSLRSEKEHCHLKGIVKIVGANDPHGWGGGIHIGRYHGGRGGFGLIDIILFCRIVCLLDRGLFSSGFLYSTLLV